MSQSDQWRGIRQVKRPKKSTDVRLAQKQSREDKSCVSFCQNCPDVESFKRIPQSIEWGFIGISPVINDCFVLIA